jgi:hypothetical protein
MTRSDVMCKQRILLKACGKWELKKCWIKTLFMVKYLPTLIQEVDKDIYFNS